MAETEPIERSASKKDKEKILELERVLLACVKAIKEIEDDQGENYMPVGTYLGVKFE